jgi:hypothetical protein
MNLGTPYYCSSCATGSTRVTMGVDGTSTGYGCTKLQTFPFSVFKECDVYNRITLSTMQLTCNKCTVDALAQGVGDYCKYPPDDCDTAVPPVPGFAVKVLNLPQCALFGMIKNCIDYSSMTPVTKILGPCKTCDVSYSPATSVTDASICLHTVKLITNCSKYEPNT